MPLGRNKTSGTSTTVNRPPTNTPAAGVHRAAASTRAKTPGLSAKWTSFMLSHPAGYLIAPTFIGGTLVKAVHLLPSWAPPYLVLFLIVVMCVDAKRRGPDFLATWIGLTMPSVALAMGGSWGRAINDWGKALRDWISAHSDQYIGTAAEVGLAVFFLSLVLFFRHVVYGESGGPFTHYVWRRYVPNLRRG